MPSNSWPSYRISSDNGETQNLMQETIGPRIWAKNHGMSFALTGLKYAGFGFPGALPRAFTFCPFGAHLYTPYRLTAFLHLRAIG